MPNIWLLAIFVSILGCCVGSFINVLIWRLPFLGHPTEFKGIKAPMTLSWPPSHCPHCHRAVRWRENLPIISWLFLRGRCGGCHKPISPRYPLVELGTGMIFSGIFAAYYISHWFANSFNGMAHGGPTLILDLFYIGALLAASGVDADWFIIPLRLPWLIIVGALLSCAAGGQPMLPSLAAHSAASRFAVGGAAGLLISFILLRAGILPRSFSGQADASLNATTAATESATSDFIASPPHLRGGPLILAAAVLLLLQIPAWLLLSRQAAVLMLLISGILIFLLGVLPRRVSATGEGDLASEVLDESAVPNARREIFKELIFVLPIIALGTTAACTSLPLPAGAALDRVYGTLLGLVAGGGIVWFFRIFGTLLLGRVAMGLGDVHLMAAVGAVLGAPLAVIAFFIAPFLALIWVVVLKIMRRPNVLPFGPWLSVAGILALLIGPPIQGWYARQLYPQSPRTRINSGQVIWPGDRPAATPSVNRP